MPVAEARNLIAPNDWEIDVQGERSDDVPMVGQVVRTAPAAGVELAEGEPFLMVVSEGPLLRELPESTGKPLSEAQTALAGLRLGVETVEQFDEVVPPGTVIAGRFRVMRPCRPARWSSPRRSCNWSSPPVRRRASCPIWSASGRRRRAPSWRRWASRSPRASRCSATTSGSVRSWPRTFRKAPRCRAGATSSSSVSRGPDLVIFPDLSAATTFEQAAAALTAAGFQPVLTFGDAQGAIQSVTIDGQPPVTGETYRRGTVVEFTAL